MTYGVEKPQSHSPLTSFNGSWWSKPIDMPARWNDTNYIVINLTACYADDKTEFARINFNNQRPIEIDIWISNYIIFLFHVITPQSPNPKLNRRWNYDIPWFYVKVLRLFKPLNGSWYSNRSSSFVKLQSLYRHQSHRLLLNLVDIG